MLDARSVTVAKRWFKLSPPYTDGACRLPGKGDRARETNDGLLFGPSTARLLALGWRGCGTKLPPFITIYTFRLPPALAAVWRDLAEARVGFLVVLLGVFLVAARAVVVFGFVFRVRFFVGEIFFFVVPDAGLALCCGFVARFLAAPIAAPESAPITVPTTGTPRAVPATAPATAPPSVLLPVPFSPLAASFSFSAMFSPWVGRNNVPLAGLPVNNGEPFLCSL